MPRALLLLCLLGCRSGSPEGTASAMRSAARGDPGAKRTCLALSDAEARGDCLVTWLEASPPPLDAAVCPDIAHEVWRSECYFVVAESRVRQGRAEEAIEACRAALKFQEDCVGHLYREAFLVGPERGDAVRAQLAAAFPAVRPPSDGAYAEERAALQAERLRADGRVSLAACATEAGPDAEACARAAAGMLRGRWERRAGADPAVRTILCGAKTSDGLPDPAELGDGLRALRWERSEVLDDAVREARVSVCGAAAPGAAG